MLLFFIWENRNIGPDDQLVLLILFSVAIIVVPSMFGYIYLKDKLDRIKIHEEEISKLKEKLYIEDKLNDIYYKLGKSSKKRGN